MLRPGPNEGIRGEGIGERRTPSQSAKFLEPSRSAKSRGEPSRKKFQEDTPLATLIRVAPGSWAGVWGPGRGDDPEGLGGLRGAPFEVVESGALLGAS